MVVGDQHVDTARLRGCNAIDAADAVVDGDDELRAASHCECDDFRRQSIAEFETIWHDEIDRRAERTQSLHSDGAIAAEVRDRLGRTAQELARMYAQPNA